MPHNENELLELTQTEREEIFEIFARLKPEDFLRNVAPPPFGIGPVSSSETLRIIERLWEPETRWRERAFAAWTIGRLSLSPSEKRTAANALCKLISNRMDTAYSSLGARAFRALKRSLTLTISGVAALAFIGISLNLFLGEVGHIREVLPYMILALIGSVLGGGMLGFYAYPLVFPVSLLLDSTRNNFVRATAVTALGRLNVPETVGTLAEAWTDTNGRVRNAAREALIAVLPSVAKLEYGHLPGETILRLCGALYRALHTFPYSPHFPEYRQMETLSLLLLDALGKIGDGRAVPVVSELLGAKVSSEIQRKAMEILPILQQRKERENAKEMLLRASSAPMSSPGELLRPAAQVTETAPEQLLRPSSLE